MYATTTLFYINDFIILFLILELQFFSLFGILVVNRNGLKILFTYLIINILGTVLLLFGLAALYLKIGTFNFSACFTELDGLSTFLPFGLLVKLTGISTPILFQKVYGGMFVEMYALALILGEASLSLVSIKIFTKILILKGWSVLTIWLLFIVAVLIFSTLAGLRTKNIINIIIYSAIQNSLILALPPITHNCLGIINGVVVFIFIYFLIIGFFINIIKFNPIYVQSVLIFVGLISLAGMPPTIGFYSKVLILSSLLTNFYYLIFSTILLANIISLCFYGKLVIQKLNTVANRPVYKKNRFFKNYTLFLYISMGFLLCFGLVFIQQVFLLSVQSHRFLLSPILCSASYEIGRAILPIFL